MKTKILLIVAAALMFTSVATEQAEAGDADLFGAVIGAGTGGFLGSHMGSGDGRLAATAAGTLIGAIVGHELATAAERTDRYETWNRPVAHRPVYGRTDVRPTNHLPHQAATRKVVVHKHKVVVKHVPARPHKGWQKKRQWQQQQWRKRQWEQDRRDLARACYEHPRRCAKAF